MNEDKEHLADGEEERSKKKIEEEIKSTGFNQKVKRRVQEAGDRTSARIPL